MRGLQLLLLLMLCLLYAARAQPAAALDVKRADVTEFIVHMHDAYGFKQRPLRKLLAGAQVQPAILDAMERPAEKAKPWYEYRPIFLNERRIREGVDFWLTHQQALERASLRTGVAPEYLAAILGVETYYGRITGSYRVLDSLSTLAFDYPARSKFFRDELEQFLLLTRDLHVDPRTVKGSYAGAMGAPQFMPSNYRLYAVDADADGHVDLWTSWADVCESVGNYLKQYGWNAGEPVLIDADVTADKPGNLDGRTLDLSESVASLKMKGVTFESPLPLEAPALLIAADEPDGTRWRVGFNNFYVITRYNHSPLYAMAVYELAGALKQRVTSSAGAPVAGTPVAGTSVAGTSAAGISVDAAVQP